MKRNRTPLHLGTQLAWSFTLLFILLLTIGNMLVRQIVMDYSLEQTSKSTYATVVQAQNRLDEALERIRLLMQTTQTQDSLMLYLNDFPANRYNYTVRQSLYNFFNNMSIQPAEIASLHVVREEEVLYRYVRFSEYYDAFEQFLAQGPLKERAAGSGLLLYGPVRTESPGGEYQSMFAVNDLYDLGQLRIIGQLVIQIKYDTLFLPLSQAPTGEGGQLYLTDAQGKILYATDGGHVGTTIDPQYATATEDGEPKTINGDMWMTKTSNVLGWRLYAAIPMRTILQPAQYVQRIILIITGIGVLAIAMLVPLLSRRFTRPLKALSERMKLVEGGLLSAQIAPSGFYELQVINNVFDDMLGRLEGMMDALVKARVSQKEAELKALQAQVNPHFLYNTLDVLNWRAVINHQDELARLIRSLGRMMRYNLTDGSRLVTLEEEILHLENYLALQKARYGEELTYRLEVPDTVRKLYVPKFLLQPIVENAVVHGLKGCKAGEVLVRAQAEDNRLCVDIMDNGIGFDQEMLKRIQEEGVETLKSAGIGLSNVSERIRLRYGPPFGLTIMQREGCTQVRLTLSILHQPDN